MSELLNALRRNLASMEGIGDEDNAQILRKRISAEEKALEKAVEPEPDPDVGPAFVTDDNKPEPVAFADLTKAELLELATQAEIEGRYAMNKAELLEALEGTT